MKIRATRIQIREYEIAEEYYPAGSTDKQILEIDTSCANDDPDLFFDDCNFDNITVEVIVAKVVPEPKPGEPGYNWPKFLDGTVRT